MGETKIRHSISWIVICSIFFCLCCSACSHKGSETEDLAEGDKTELQETEMSSKQSSYLSNRYLSYADCDEETVRKLNAYLEDFFKVVKFGGFDQGHTNAVWYWAAQALCQQGKAVETDGIYAISKEDARQWLSQYVIVPEGSEVRLEEGMPRAEAEFPIVSSNGKLLFFQQEGKDSISFEIQTAWKNDATYLLGGEVTRISNGEEWKAYFTAKILEDTDGSYRFERINTDGFSSYFMDTKSVPVNEEYQKRAEDVWKLVSEIRGQNGTERKELSLEDMAEAEEALKFFFGTPMLGSFTQECIGAAVSFSVQKLLRTELRSLTYHESADYYTITVDALAEWMREYFVVLENYDRQVKEVQNDNSLVRVEGNRIVFRYCEPSESEPFCIDGGVDENGRWLIYGHNSLTIGKGEFVAVFERMAEQNILLREFYLR